MNCSEYLVDFLINHGVTDVFGYAGGYIVPFMDALYKRQDEINTSAITNKAALLRQSVLLGQVGIWEFILQLPVPVL